MLGSVKAISKKAIAPMEAEENAEQLVLVMRSRTRMLGCSLAMTS